MKIKRFLINLRYGLVLDKPRFMIRLIKNMIGIILFGKKKLRHVDINMSTECNLKCEHCFASDFKKNDKPLTIKEWENVADQCNELGSLVFQLTGGEPLCNPEIFDIIKALHPKKNIITVATNATLLDEEKIIKLKESGVDVIVVSLDNGEPQEHDNFRGMDGAYEKSMEAIKLCMKNNMKVSIVTTVTHESLRSKGLIRLLDYSKNNHILLLLAIIAPAGRAMENEDYLFTKDDSEYLDKEILPHYPNARRDWETNYWTTGCGAATEKIYVTSYGEVISCPYIHISFGNIREETIKNIRERMLEVKKLKKYENICIAAEDKEFIEKYMKQITKHDTAPVSYKQIEGIFDE